MEWKVTRSDVISEQDALEIVRMFLDEIRRIDGVNPRALYLVGSLGGGYYRPGQSDIDTILLIDSNAEDVWGTFDRTAPAINTIRERYRSEYAIPKGFGAVAIREKHLFPPYPVSVDESDLFVFEVARLKTQGRLFSGDFDLDIVPMPSKKDLLETMLRFDHWFSEVFLANRPLDRLNLTESVNCLVGAIQGLLLVEHDLLEFNKFELMERAVELYAAPEDVPLYRSVLGYLHGENETPDPTEIANRMDALRNVRNKKAGLCLKSL